MTKRTSDQKLEGDANRQSLNSKKYNNLNKAETLQKYLDSLIHAEYTDSLTMADNTQLSLEDNSSDPLEILLTEDEKAKMMDELAKIPRADLYAAYRIKGAIDTSWPELEAEFAMSKYNLLKLGNATIEYLEGDFRDKFESIF